MTVTYSDPYKSNKFGKIKGSKHDAFFKVVFSEAKLYKHDNAYILAGQYESFIGVPRAYGSEPINPGLVELPIYGSEYEIRQKKPGTGLNGTKSEYESIKIQPSTAEQLLYKHIEDNPSTYLEDGKCLAGDMAFYPNDNFNSLPDDDSKLKLALGSVNINQIEPTGKLEEWQAPKPYSGKSGWNNSSVTPQEKLVILKKELSETVNTHSVRENKDLPVAAYIHQIIKENEDNERFLVCYFDLMKALVS